MELAVIILNLVIILLIIWSNLKTRSNDDGFDTEKITSEIELQIVKQQANSVEKILEKLSSNQQIQNQILTQNSEKLDRRFQEIQISLQERLTKSIQDLVAVNNKNFELLSTSNQERLNQINLDVQKRLDENFARNIESFKQVSENLGHIQATATKMIESTKSVDKLNTIFARTSSKAFGDFGEKYLETLLRDHLHESSWKSQVMVPGSSDKIDFVIYIDGKKIGIDSKFPVTKFQDFIEATPEEKSVKRKDYLRAVLTMATEISAKYLNSKLGFLDTLFLYLPSDSMYNELVSDEKSLTFLSKLKVTACSPSTIFPIILIIQTYQFKADISKRAEEIIAGLQGVKKNVQGFKEEFRKLGDKIRQAQDNYDKADRNLIGVERNILALSSAENNESSSENNSEQLQIELN